MRAIVLAVLAGCAALQQGGALEAASAGAPARAPDHRDLVTREESRRLIGLTVADAKQQLASLGYHGKIQLDPSTDVTDAKCQYDRVCDVFPEDFALDAPIALRVGQAKLEIAPP